MESIFNKISRCKQLKWAYDRQGHEKLETLLFYNNYRNIFEITTRKPLEANKITLRVQKVNVNIGSIFSRWENSKNVG